MNLKGKTKNSIMKKLENRKIFKSSKKNSNQTDQAFSYDDLTYSRNNSSRLKQGEQPTDAKFCFNLNKYKKSLSTKKDKLSSLISNKSVGNNRKVRDGSLSNKNKKHFNSDQASPVDGGQIKLSKLGENFGIFMHKHLFFLSYYSTFYFF